MERNDSAVLSAANMETLLVVDDDDEIRELLSSYLNDAGYRVLQAANGTQMWQLLQHNSVHLLILDLMLPGEDGLQLCRQLHDRPGMGVIMLSAKGSALDRIIGLEVGADDYVAKPFEPRELLARIKAVLRRAERLAPVAPNPKSETTTLFAGCRLEHAKRLLFLPNGAQLTLPRSDYRVLRNLLEARNQVVSRHHLTRNVFGREHMPDDRSVDMCISRLRQHLKQLPGPAVHILTIRNEGYLLSIPNEAL